jgi:putative ABC transport system permease protein
MLLAGLTLSVALWISVQAINAEARQSYDRAAADLSGRAGARLSPVGSQMIPVSTFTALRRQGILVSPVLTGTLEVQDRTFMLTGIDPLTLEEAEGDLSPRSIEDLVAFLGSSGDLIVSEKDAAFFASVGAFSARASETLQSGNVLADIARAERLLGRSGELSYLLLSARQDREVAQSAGARLGLVLDNPAAAADLSRLTDSFHLNLTAFGLLAFAVGLFIVYSATGLAFENRRAVFGALRVLGFPMHAIMILAGIELAAFILIGGIGGTIGGYLIAAILLPDVAATLSGLYGASVSSELTLQPAWWMNGFLVSAIGGSIASVQSFARMARLPLLSAMRRRAWSADFDRHSLRMALLGSALLGGAVILYWLGDGLIAGFALIGALLIGWALCLPMMIALIISAWSGRLRSPLSRWFFADCRLQLNSMSLALMALLLALSTNIGVTTMVGSFRNTFDGWLDQRLAAEAYFTPSAPEQAEVMRSWLTSRTETVLPLLRSRIRSGDQDIDVMAVTEHETYEKAWPILSALPDAWALVWRGDAVLINEQLSYRASLSPGDRLDLGPGWTAVIAGIYSDYGNPLSQILVGSDTFSSRFPMVTPSGFGVRAPPSVAAQLVEGMTIELGPGVGTGIDQASAKRQARAVFERTFRVTEALGVITFAVAGIALFAALSSLSQARLPQLAPLWAAGVSLRTLLAMELGRILFLAALTFVMALPLGLMLAHILLDKINVDAFGWRLPMALFPLDWIRLAGLSLMCAFLAALPPLRTLSRAGATQLTGLFSHDR